MTTDETKPEKYASVNGVWPEGSDEGRAVVPTEQEAIAGARKLYRVAMGRTFPGRFVITSGNRRTRIRGGVFYVNPNSTWDRGWHGIVHSISHHASWRLYRENHGPRHAFIERELIRTAVEGGFLEGRLKRAEKPKPEVDKTAQAIERVAARIKRWEAKARRAENALRKLNRQRRRYERKAVDAGVEARA